MLADTEVKRKGEIYQEPSMMELGKKIGLVEKSGNGWECLGEKYKAQSLLVQRMIEEPDYFRLYSEALMTVLTAG